jgi:hypothetical protein
MRQLDRTQTNAGSSRRLVVLFTTTEYVFAYGWQRFSHVAGPAACAKLSTKMAIFACGQGTRMRKSDFRMRVVKPTACKEKKSPKKIKFQKKSKKKKIKMIF